VAAIRQLFRNRDPTLIAKLSPPDREIAMARPVDLVRLARIDRYLAGGVF
jgi:hypothetical protein